MNTSCVGMLLSVVAVVCWTSSGDGVPQPEGLLREYLIGYRHQLNGLVAEEHYEQVVPTATAGGKYRVPSVGVRERTMVSDIVLVSEGASVPWLALRIIRRVDGRDIPDSASRVRDILADHTGDLLERSQKLATENARMNIGDDRDINLPTLPLTLLDPTNAGHFQYRLKGTKRRQGVLLLAMEFSEVTRPTLIRTNNGGELQSRGTVWMDPSRGTIFAVEMECVPLSRIAGGEPSTLAVEFGAEEHLGIVVPRVMTETYAAGVRTGTGKAKYINYRRFDTEVRIRH